jgi:hypothetical protein
VVTHRRTWLDVSTCDSSSKLVCPNVSFVVVTESILFRLVNLCSSYGVTLASGSRFLVNGETS